MVAWVAEGGGQLSRHVWLFQYQLVDRVTGFEYVMQLGAAFCFVMSVCLTICLWLTTSSIFAIFHWITNWILPSVNIFHFELMWMWLQSGTHIALSLTTKVGKLELKEWLLYLLNGKCINRSSRNLFLISSKKRLIPCQKKKNVEKYIEKVTCFKI